MMRLAVIIASLLGILIALPLLYVGLFVIRSAWFAPGQLLPATLLLLLWVLGVYGTAGLCLNLVPAPRLRPGYLQLQVLFLITGIVAAFATVALQAVYLVLGIGVGLIWIVLIFPGLPVFAAISRLVGISLETDRKDWGRAVVCLLLLPAVLILCGMAVRETLVWWYGQDLVARVHQSAQQIAGEEPYCIVPNGLFFRDEELDPELAVLRALGQRFDIGPNTQFIKRPHFELETRGQIYHWSFESGAFEASRSQSLMRFSRQPCLPSANAQGN